MKQKHVQNKRQKIYVGICVNTHAREIFKSAETPTEETHGARYVCVIGYFRTMRGACYMRDYGYNNPCCQSVHDAEKFARQIAQEDRAAQRLRA